ncbi:hypothetical protein B0T18DRAFT_119685 [Schizothecium vesticola]|uniref:Uncharacterized protein n=1 Tax=Schizothecium vesticola TaxID=314040 RepID=A0AA40F2G1_9PEZI|nr:hypothetical protein B0T18DRAFT_119685 [Schizothecium vesticola]
MSLNPKSRRRFRRLLLRLATYRHCPRLPFARLDNTRRGCMQILRSGGIAIWKQDDTGRHTHALCTEGHHHMAGRPSTSGTRPKPTMPSYTSKPESTDASGIERNANIEARIRNPPAGIPHAQLLARVETLALEKEFFHHIAILRKGALVAQSLGHVLNITGNEALTEGRTG